MNSLLMIIQKLEDKKRRFDLIKQNLYIVEINFKNMSRTFSIDWKDLQFDQATLESIQESKFKLKGIPVYRQLDNARRSLVKLRNDWEYKRTILVDGQRVVTQGQMQQCTLDILEIKELADRFRENLLDLREEGLKELQHKVEKFLLSFNVEPKIIEEKLNLIACQFPQEDEINNMLQVEARYTKLISLIEQLEQDQEAEVLKNYGLTMTAIAEIRESQAQQVQRLKRLKEEIFSEAENIVRQILLENLEKLNEVTLGENNKCLRNKILKHLNKLQALLDLDLNGNFAEIEHNLNKLHDFFVSSIDYDSNIESKIISNFDRLRQNLINSYDEIAKVNNPENLPTIRTSNYLVA